MRTVVRLTGMCLLFPSQKDPDGAFMPLLLQFRLKMGASIHFGTEAHAAVNAVPVEGSKAQIF
ncbi:hypothetical protein ESP47_03410 [Heyndrickxia coagulans]|mgnify:FL=1|uniref:Uncharacterized protein n=1 Tax=Heyndrickxia coagulans TaxID=1398 RepID=A0AAN0T7C7_HEYCO|nr:hypothetical protein SB48_HM08orf03829 [Heyndrickxia coagulans]MBQ4910841.1 hypothetical protein [Heyndrickxia faecalis]AKN55287.1 D-alanyl-D-alanine carboxypeptidase [Heyndrickxia coagulans]ATW83372.1 hypothetical protein CIW84_10460 [Heyndrickxia coagulans]KGB28147.1 hypothetical protein IE89_18750 [Heyndrickxia coagulans]